MKAFSLAAILAASLLASCSSSVEGPVPTAPGSMAPIVTGIRVTAENGQFLGNWGNPTDGPDAAAKPVISGGGTPVGGTVGTTHVLEVLAPNPCSGKCSIRFVSDASTVRMWVVPARLAGMSGPDAESIVGARVVSPRLTVVRTLVDARLETAQYVTEWDGTDAMGHTMPSGFYRIFLSINNKLFWRDLLFYNTPDELPGSLRNMVD